MLSILHLFMKQNRINTPIIVFIYAGVLLFFYGAVLMQVPLTSGRRVAVNVQNVQKCFMCFTTMSKLNTSELDNTLETKCSLIRQTLPSMLPPGKLDQTTLSDIRLLPPSGALGETYTWFLILAHSFHYVKHDAVHKTEST